MSEESWLMVVGVMDRMGMETGRKHKEMLSGDWIVLYTYRCNGYMRFISVCVYQKLFQLYIKNCTFCFMKNLPQLKMLIILPMQTPENKKALVHTQKNAIFFISTEWTTYKGPCSNQIIALDSITKTYISDVT